MAYANFDVEHANIVEKVFGVNVPWVELMSI